MILRDTNNESVLLTLSREIGLLKHPRRDVSSLRGSQLQINRLTHLSLRWKDLGDSLQDRGEPALSGYDMQG